jgi:AMP deaminase
MGNGAVKSLSHRRLQLLEHRFSLHQAVTHSTEAGATAQRSSTHRDFYQTSKVDTNVRMESGMTARQLLHFIIAKARDSGDDVVLQKKGHEGEEPLTLRRLLQDLHIDPAHLTVDDLNVQADATAVQAEAVAVVVRSRRSSTQRRATNY